MSIECGVVTHFYNEELLLGPWIEHHRKLFDYGILINHRSTDNSMQIVIDNMPPNWQVVHSRLLDFDAYGTDDEVMFYERQLPSGIWKIALNTTEFMFCPNLKERLAELKKANPDTIAFGTRAFSFVDNELNKPIESPIWKNRNWGFLNYGEGNPIIRYWRWFHHAEDGRYVVGRHMTHLPSLEVPDFYHLHFLMSPWPECRKRKLQIQTQIPQSNIDGRLGYQHMLNLDQLEARRAEYLNFSRNLHDDPTYKEVYDKMLKLFEPS